jgi:SAM-dependent methyltransferase
MMSPKDVTQQYYSARAGEYESTVSYVRSKCIATTSRLIARYRLELEDKDVLEIACGPGFWSEAVALTARSITATDQDASLVAMTAARLSGREGVRCLTADAYDLGDVGGPFTAAFANFWWSHVPRARLPAFLATLHGKLLPGAVVLFVDDLPYHWRGARRTTPEGDLLEERALKNGETFEIIKNFPTEREIAELLDSVATEVDYRAFPDQGYWLLRYRTNS